MRAPPGPFGPQRRASCPAADGTEPMPWTVAAGRARGRRPGRRRPHRSDHRDRGGLRNAVQRADGTAPSAAGSPPQNGAGLARYRLASKLIKGQPLGGTARRMGRHRARPPGRRTRRAAPRHPRATAAPLFGRFAFERPLPVVPRPGSTARPGQRLGLAPIPADPVTPQDAAANTGDELAYRPGGLLAAKLHLKHMSVATTEGYAVPPGRRPGRAPSRGQQARDRPQPRAGPGRVPQLPAGHHARRARRPRAHRVLRQHRRRTARSRSRRPKIQRSDREILNLLTKRASTLHLGTANYCWFTDPSRALCLKLAGTPAADKPLAGMCDSARCPQATHHPCHRPVWAEHVSSTKTFLGALGRTRTDRARPPASRLRPRPARPGRASTPPPPEPEEH